MACSVGSGKMAVMARLLAFGSSSQAITEKAVCQKLVAQYIHRELLEADDPNLLDEEDMHIFDLNPLRDPLHLVCCNSCKKPVKASKFVAHADVPAPLMTKAYYSQRSNRLQAAISQMYVQASIQEHCGNNRNLQGNVTTWEASSPRIFDDQQFDDSSSKVQVLGKKLSS